MAKRDVSIDLVTTDGQKTIPELRKTSLSGYSISTVPKQAQPEERKNKTLILSSRDREKVIEALENPPEPNEKLKELFR